MVYFKRQVVFLLFSLFLISGLYSVDSSPLLDNQIATHIISSYSFSIDGSTKESALRKKMFTSEMIESFTTEEAMVKSLNEKQQSLMNTRLFSDVSYTYIRESTNNGIASYEVTFTIKDASTFLILPYPKFDNDTIGLRLGIKIFEKNLFGTLADLVIVGNVSQGDGGLSGWKNREDFLSLSISSLPIGQANLNLDIEYEQKQHSVTNGTLNLSTNLTNIPLLGTKIGIAPWAYFSPSSDFSQWNVEEYGLKWDVGPFRLNGELASLSNTLKIHTNNSQLYTYSELKSNKVKFLFIPVDFYLSVETDMEINPTQLLYAIGGATIEGLYKLPFKFVWNPSIGAYVNIKPEYSSVAYSYIIKNSITRSNINWTGNFRKGLSLSFTHTYEKYTKEMYKDLTNWNIEAKATLFPFYTKNFNPSFQFTALFTDSEHGKEFDFSGNAADNLRGIWSKTVEDLGLNGNVTLATIYNLNLSMNFIDFGFAKSYISPFIDVGVFNDPNNIGESLVLTSAGVEGYAIINKFPSYPIRGSLGINLSDIKRVIDEEISITEIEFELSIGMGLFF